MLTARKARLAAVSGLAAASVTGATLALASGAQASGTVWDRVAACESGGDWHINTGNGYYGGLQFSASTWRGFGGGVYAARADLATKDQQITIAKKVLRVQGPGAWPVCSRRAGLTVANGLAVATSGAGGGVSRGEPRNPVVTAGRLVVDVVRGPRTNAAIERWVGGTVNGALSVSDTMKLQRKVGAVADGQFGPRSTRALQRVVGAAVDGVWGSGTTRALQSYLNRVLGRGRVIARRDAAPEVGGVSGLGASGSRAALAGVCGTGRVVCWGSRAARACWSGAIGSAPVL